MINSVKNILPQHQSRFNRDGAGFRRVPSGTRFRLGNPEDPVPDGMGLARGDSQTTVKVF